MRRTFRSLVRLAALWPLLAVLVAPRTATATPTGSAQALQALDWCDRSDDLSGEAREDLLERALHLAEEAVEANPRDAAAHYALFCNLGKKMEESGLNPLNVPRVWRLRHAIDQALELQPDDPDLLSAKGALLAGLPRLLGGDPDEAERLLRRSLEIEPENRVARRQLQRLGRLPPEPTAGPVVPWIRPAE